MCVIPHFNKLGALSSK